MALPSDPTSLSLAEARDTISAKKISSRELTSAFVKAIEDARPLNAFVTETPDRALAMADESDARLAKGEKRALEGLPLAIKDLFCTKGVRTTAGSKILGNFVPPYESTITQNLWNAGAVMLGKTNMDEFAMGSSNETSHFGPVFNPWRARNSNSNLVPGGSSGGSAASVAGQLCLAATGTDTGGSIRQPAAVSGIVGMKPTYGRCSRFGIVAFASSLDQAGPMTRTVQDAAILLKEMASIDPRDSTSVDVPVPDYEADLEKGVKGLRVGIPKEYRIDGAPPEIEGLWTKGAEWLKAQGAEIVDVSLPHTKYALPTYYIVAPAEASSNLARYDGVRYGHRAKDSHDIIELYEKSRAEGFGAEVQRRILIGTYVLSSGYYDAYYARAQKLRTLILRDFTRAFERCDVLLTPATPGPAFAVGEKTADPVSMYLNDVFTVTVNLAGLPGLAVPAGLTANGLPLGLQIIGKAFDEPTVLRAGRAVERAANFHARPQHWWRGA
jgi:aspartyl-tRNA(Asn)/glutamyl-tRNA(Gln) amidotransferase subunit A